MQGIFELRRLIGVAALAYFGAEVRRPRHGRKLGLRLCAEERDKSYQSCEEANLQWVAEIPWRIPSRIARQPSPSGSHEISLQDARWGCLPAGNLLSPVFRPLCGR